MRTNNKRSLVNSPNLPEHARHPQYNTRSMKLILPLAFPRDSPQIALRMWSRKLYILQTEHVTTPGNCIIYSDHRTRALGGEANSERAITGRQCFGRLTSRGTTVNGIWTFYIFQVTSCQAEEENGVALLSPFIITVSSRRVEYRYLR